MIIIESTKIGNILKEPAFQNNGRLLFTIHRSIHYIMI